MTPGHLCSSPTSHLDLTLHPRHLPSPAVTYPHLPQALLEENPAKHPIIILKDVPFQHLTAILEFMYAGEVRSPTFTVFTPLTQLTQ